MSEMRPPRLPNFFLVGAPKAGTTSLFHALAQHPQIYTSPVKEPCYFAGEIRPERFDAASQRRLAREAEWLRAFLEGSKREPPLGAIVTDWNDYLRLFAHAGTEAAIGEASVCYLWSPSAPANIAARISDARIVVVLRDPAERAFSQYLHGLSAAAIRWSFREHIERNLRHSSQELCIHYPLLEFGRYYEQVRRYLDVFGRRQVLIRLYEDHGRDLVRDVFSFLGVDADVTPDQSRRHLEGRPPKTRVAGWLARQGAGRFLPQRLKAPLKRALFRSRRDFVIDPRDRQFLVGYYRDDIRKLESLLNRDLSAWLS